MSSARCLRAIESDLPGGSGNFTLCAMSYMDSEKDQTLSYGDVALHSGFCQASARPRPAPTSEQCLRVCAGHGAGQGRPRPDALTGGPSPEPRPAPPFHPRGRSPSQRCKLFAHQSRYFEQILIPSGFINQPACLGRSLAPHSSPRGALPGSPGLSPTPSPPSPALKALRTHGPRTPLSGKGRTGPGPKGTHGR